MSKPQLPAAGTSSSAGILDVENPMSDDDGPTDFCDTCTKLPVFFKTLKCYQVHLAASHHVKPEQAARVHPAPAANGKFECSKCLKASCMAYTPRQMKAHIDLHHPPKQGKPKKATKDDEGQTELDPVHLLESSDFDQKQSIRPRHGKGGDGYAVTTYTTAPAFRPPGYYPGKEPAPVREPQPDPFYGNEESDHPLVTAPRSENSIHAPKVPNRLAIHLEPSRVSFEAVKTGIASSDAILFRHRSWCEAVFTLSQPTGSTMEKLVIDELVHGRGGSQWKDVASQIKKEAEKVFIAEYSGDYTFDHTRARVQRKDGKTETVFFATKNPRQLDFKKTDVAGSFIRSLRDFGEYVQALTVVAAIPGYPTLVDVVRQKSENGAHLDRKQAAGELSVAEVTMNTRDGIRKACRYHTNSIDGCYTLIPLNLNDDKSMYCVVARADELRAATKRMVALLLTDGKWDGESRVSLVLAEEEDGAIRFNGNLAFGLRTSMLHYLRETSMFTDPLDLKKSHDASLKDEEYRKATHGGKDKEKALMLLVCQPRCRSLATAIAEQIVYFMAHSPDLKCSSTNSIGGEISLVKPVKVVQHYVCNDAEARTVRKRGRTRAALKYNVRVADKKLKLTQNERKKDKAEKEESEFLAEHENDFGSNSPVPNPHLLPLNHLSLEQASRVLLPGMSVTATKTMSNAKTGETTTETVTASYQSPPPPVMVAMPQPSKGTVIAPMPMMFAPTAVPVGPPGPMYGTALKLGPAAPPVMMKNPVVESAVTLT